MSNVIDAIYETNPDRSIAASRRRFMKLVEELGEVSEAWLNATSEANAKNKSWDDVHEESVDCLLVAIDIALTLKGDEWREAWQRSTREIVLGTSDAASEALSHFYDRQMNRIQEHHEFHVNRSQKQGLDEAVFGLLPFVHEASDLIVDLVRRPFRDRDTPGRIDEYRTAVAQTMIALIGGLLEISLYRALPPELSFSERVEKLEAIVEEKNAKWLRSLSSRTGVV